MKIPVEIIQIDPSGYHAFVNLEWKGSVLRMLLDTGASRSVLGKEWFAFFAADHPIADIKEPSFGINSEVLITSHVSVKDLFINGHPVPECMFSLIGLEGVNKLYSSLDVPAINGIIGADWLVKWKAILDFESLYLRLNFQGIYTQNDH